MHIGKYLCLFVLLALLLSYNPYGPVLTVTDVVVFLIYVIVLSVLLDSVFQYREGMSLIYDYDSADFDRNYRGGGTRYEEAGGNIDYSVKSRLNSQNCGFGCGNCNSELEGKDRGYVSWESPVVSEALGKRKMRA